MQDGDVLAVLGEEFSAVCEAGRVDYFGEHGVVQYCGELVGGHICDCGAERLEGGVGGREDCYVGLGGELFDEVGGVESTLEGGVVEGVEGIRKVGGWDEEGVNNLDDTAIEGEILGVSLSFVS